MVGVNSTVGTVVISSTNCGMYQKLAQKLCYVEGISSANCCMCWEITLHTVVCGG